jgi:ketosteroid isomerase-like protein
MSETDVETIRRGIAALNSGDVDGMASTLDPDVELVPLRAVLDGTSYRGHEGLRRWVDDMVEDWSRFEIAVDEVRELAPGRLLVRATMRLRGRLSGVALDSPGAWLCDMRGAKVSRIQFFTDSEAALAAADEAGR